MLVIVDSIGYLCYNHQTNVAYPGRNRPKEKERPPNEKRRRLPSNWCCRLRDGCRDRCYSMGNGEVKWYHSELPTRCDLVDVVCLCCSWRRSNVSGNNDGHTGWKFSRADESNANEIEKKSPMSTTRRGFLLFFVVYPLKMQHSVGNEFGDFLFDAVTGHFRLAKGRLSADNDVP